jgi:hypothetical protein
MDELLVAAQDTGVLSLADKNLRVFPNLQEHRADLTDLTELGATGFARVCVCVSLARVSAKRGQRAEQCVLPVLTSLCVVCA